MTVVITENIVKKRDTYLRLAKAFIEDAKEDRECIIYQEQIPFWRW